MMLIISERKHLEIAMLLTNDLIQFLPMVKNKIVNLRISCLINNALSLFNIGFSDVHRMKY